MCWEERGCDAEMASRCPHATSSVDGVCVAECCYTHCDRPQHKVCVEPAIFFDPLVNRQAAVKQICTFCGYFLSRGPKLVEACENKKC